MNNLENNKLIAEFMGKKNAEELQYSHTNQHGVNVYQSIHRYDTDWDWLMGVVDKIEHDMAWVKIRGCLVIISHIEVVKPTKIEATYQAVVEFIKWYNINNK